MLLPARLMKNWIMRMPEPIPFGLTFLLAIVRATVGASFVNRPAGGEVGTVFTPWLHFFFFLVPASSFFWGPVIVKPICPAQRPLKLPGPGRHDFSGWLRPH